MHSPFRTRAFVVLVICFGFAVFASAQTPSQVLNSNQAETKMTAHASGTFEVKLTPQAAEDKVEAVSIGRVLIDKQFLGDLIATSKGEMLAHRTAINGSAGYVAMEHVRGTLQGRNGTFVLQHSGTMTRSVPELTITVVPDSGTDELTGLAGKMMIDIVEGKHYYEFEYTITHKP
ncbi:MAG: DUF3224 domain-containing protein [candidate division KSB1 bacterium]